jgi:hypothetical protein
MASPMSTFHPEVAAVVLAAELVERYPAALDPAMRDHLAGRIEALLVTAMAAEREACAELCARRQALWERTENDPATVEVMRAEARFRGNEAAYLSDALRERTGP